MKINFIIENSFIKTHFKLYKKNIETLSFLFETWGFIIKNSFVDLCGH